jgi:hypothetical protein
VSAVSDARAHLEKAREFLDAARDCLEAGHHNAASSNAVIASINAKDAICLRLSGVTRKADDHAAAVRELKAVGPLGTTLAPTLSRLLRLKTKSQYQSASVSAVDAAKACDWAARMVQAARDVLSSG